MADRAGEVLREQVFCHECQSEWPRVDHGLTCPSCGSEFTEIIEENNDPRGAQATDTASAPIHHDHNHDLFMHNPWGDHVLEVTEAEGDDLTEHGSGPDGSVQVTRFVIRSDTPRGSEDGPRQSESPVFDSFQRMIQSIIGNGPMHITPHGMHHPSGSGHGHHVPNLDGRTGQARAPSPGAAFNGPSGVFPPPFVGGSITFSSTSRLHPRDANNPQPQNQIVDDLPGLLHRLLHDLHHAPSPDQHGSQDDTGRPTPNPLLGFFANFVNPATAHGDVVYSQEALDRVISQMMEQYSGSNAPGPASENAIASLPRKKIELGMLDDEGKAECTICMDDVPVGTEVMSLPCGHWFHEQCGGAWLREHDTCPICRKGIMPKEGSGEESRMPGQEARHPEPWRMQDRVGEGSGRPSSSRRTSSHVPRRSRSGEQHGSRTGTDGGGLSGRVRGWFGGGSSG